MSTKFDEKGWDNYWAMIFGLFILPLVFVLGFVECSERISEQRTQDSHKSYCNIVTFINQTENLGDFIYE